MSRSGLGGGDAFWEEIDFFTHFFCTPLAAGLERHSVSLFDGFSQVPTWLINVGQNKDKITHFHDIDQVRLKTP